MHVGRLVVGSQMDEFRGNIIIFFVVFFALNINPTHRAHVAIHFDTHRSYSTLVELCIRTWRRWMEWDFHLYSGHKAYIRNMDWIKIKNT